MYPVEHGTFIPISCFFVCVCVFGVLAFAFALGDSWRRAARAVCRGRPLSTTAFKCTQFIGRLNAFAERKQFYLFNARIRCKRMHHTNICRTAKNYPEKNERNSSDKKTKSKGTQIEEDANRFSLVNINLKHTRFALATLKPSAEAITA